MASLTKTAMKTAISQKFRPAPPKDLIKKIVGYLSERVSLFIFVFAKMMHIIFLFYL